MEGYVIWCELVDRSVGDQGPQRQQRCGKHWIVAELTIVVCLRATPLEVAAKWVKTHAYIKVKNMQLAFVSHLGEVSWTEEVLHTGTLDRSAASITDFRLYATRRLPPAPQPPPLNLSTAIWHLFALRIIYAREKREKNPIQHVLAAHRRGWSEGCARSGIVMDQLNRQRP